MSKNLTKEEVLSVASVAKVYITDSEADRYAEQMNSMLKNAQELINADTEGIEPMINPLNGTITLRDDIVKPSLTQDEALRCASQKEHGHFKVPRTIDG